MANSREQAKRLRIDKLAEFIKQAKERDEVINKEKLISLMIVDHAISRKTALEEVNAIMNYDFDN